jgi:hypothetical protein
MFPLQDDPAIFGMHANAEISSRSRQAHVIEVLNMLAAAQETMASTTGVELPGGNSEVLPVPSSPRSRGNASVVAQCTSALSASLGRRGLLAGEGCTASGSAGQRLVDKLLSDLPQWRKADIAKSSGDVAGTDGGTYERSLGCCLTAFMSREATSFDKLVRTIHGNLQALADALAGRTCMSDELAEAASALRDGHIPKAWRLVAYPSSRPLASWVSNLQQRIDMISSWESRAALPSCFRISHMFFPQGFLTSLLQAFARSSGAALETLKLQHVVKSAFTCPEDITAAPAQGVFVFGVYLKGGRWDSHNQQLEDCRPGALYSAMPVIHFIPVATSLQSKFSSTHDGLPQGVRHVKDKESAIFLDPVETGLSQSMPMPASPIAKSPANAVRALSRERSVARGGAKKAAKGKGEQDWPEAAAVVVPHQYECPLYQTSVHEGTTLSSGQSKNNFCTIFLPTASEPSRWILAGVSLVCEPEE